MKSTKQRITGILLAGGKSRRMGQEKGELLLGNQRLFEYPLNLLESVCDEILVSSCKAGNLFPGYRVVCDEIEGIGPMGGIHTCLKHSSTELNIVLSYDMPLINEGLIRHLIGHSDEMELVVPALHPGKPEPLCGVYRKSMQKVLGELIEKRAYAVHRAIPLVRSLVVPIGLEMPFYRPDLFLNINQLSDLKHLPEDFGHEA
ncbi:MAG: molybdenum cofactor guanylyltransferase [Bacteroidota bacterium]